MTKGRFQPAGTETGVCLYGCLIYNNLVLKVNIKRSAKQCNEHHFAFNAY